jgi:hypothetical protein
MDTRKIQNTDFSINKSFSNRYFLGLFFGFCLMDQKLMHTGKIQNTDFWLKSDFLTKKALFYGCQVVVENESA